MRMEARVLVSFDVRREMAHPRWADRWWLGTHARAEVRRVLHQSA